MSLPSSVPATNNSVISPETNVISSSGQGLGPGSGTNGSRAGINTGYSPGSEPVNQGKGQLAQLLTATIAASGLVLLPPPPLTIKNLTIHTSLLSTKQQLLHQQQQLQQLHHAQINAALKKQQQQQQYQRQMQLQQKQHEGTQPLSTEDCSPSALSDETIGEGERERESGLMDCASREGGMSPSQVTSRSTTRVTSPTPGSSNPKNNGSGFSMLGESGIDHYPPPDQWNYTMTRYHASLIPLSQIEEPPTFYEEMDDHLPIDTDDNEEYDSLSFDDNREAEKERENNNDHISLPPLTKPHRQHDDKNNYNHNHNHNNNSHGLYSQEHFDGHQDEHEFCMQPCNNINNRNTTKHQNQINNNQDTNNITSNHLQRHIDTSHEQTQPETEDVVDEISDKDATMTKHRRRRDRTLNNSGEQIFFYDGSNLMHAKLYSDRERGKCDSVSEDMTGASHQAFPGTATATTCSHEPRVTNGDTNHNSAVVNTLIPTTTESQQTAALTAKDIFNPDGNKSFKIPTRSKSPTRPRSRSRSKSPSRPRPITPQSAASARSHTRSRSAASEFWSRTISEGLLKKEQLPSSFPKARPSFLTRGFSADSTSTQEIEYRGRDAGSSANGSFTRKATAKERLVAIVTRSTGSSTPPVDVVNGAHDGPLPRSFPDGIEERFSPRHGRSIMLNQTHTRHQGSPSVTRSSFNEQLVAGQSRPTDNMMGFPYNNSSLLLSASRMSSNLRTTRQSKPRPLSVATMEKVIESSGRYEGAEHKQESPRDDKYSTSQDQHDYQFNTAYRHQHSTHVEQGNSGENAATRPRIIGSGSHPLLATLSTFHGSSVHPVEESTEKGEKGKEIVREHDPKKIPQSILEDLAKSSGPLHVHEHHIHHHYYCQHYPPLIHTGTGTGETDQPEQQHFSTVVHRRRPDSTPLLFGSAALQHPRRLSVMEMGFCASPTDNGGSFASPLDDSNNAKPLINKKKKSILGTMSMTSSMRKRFFTEQKKEQSQPTGQTHGTHRRLSIPFFSSSPSKYEEDGSCGPTGATIRARRNHKSLPLEELSDEEDEFGMGSTAPSDNNSNQQQQQRAKFLSRLKKFLLKPSSSSRNSGVIQDNNNSSSASPPITPTETRSAATVRVTKSRWSRSGNNIPVHFGQDDLDSEHNSSEALPSFPAHQRTVRRKTYQDMFDPPASTLQRRERIDIRTQFQQSSPSTQERHAHYHHHHHHHHEASSPQEQHQHHGTILNQQSEQRPPSQRQKMTSSDIIAAVVASAATTTFDIPRSVDSTDRHSSKSPVNSILSSLPLNDKDFSDHDTLPTTCSTSPVVTKPVATASTPLPSTNADAL